MNNLYKIHNLFFGYNRDETVFSNLNLNILRDKITIIVGSNGAGKTTLCRLLTGLNKNYQGSIEFNGKELSSLKQGVILDEVLYIKQDLVGNFLGVTPQEDLKIWQNRFHEKDTEEKALLRYKTSKIMGVETLIDKPIWELSYGQRRRTMLATLGLYINKFWIIDEPTASLDTDGINQLTGLLKLKKESSCGGLILTHRPELFIDFINDADNPAVMYQIEKSRIDVVS